MKKILTLSALFALLVAFLFYFTSFTTTEASNALLDVYAGNSNGWQITGLENGEEIPLTADEALNTPLTTILRRTVEEDWTRYSRIELNSNRAYTIFVDGRLVFSSPLQLPDKVGELPLLEEPQGITHSMVFTLQPNWVGKEITMVTKLFKDVESASIGFTLVGDWVWIQWEEATTSKSVFPGAIFGVSSLLLFGLFLYRLFTTKRGYPILLLAFAALLQMLCCLGDLQENPFPAIDSTLATIVYFLFPLCYVGTKVTWHKGWFWGLALSLWGVYFGLYLAVFHFSAPLPPWFDRLDVLGVVLFGVLLFFSMKEKRANPFFRRFLRLMTLFGLGYVALFLLTAIFYPFLHQTMQIYIDETIHFYFRPILYWAYTTVLYVLLMLTVWDLLEEQIKNAQAVSAMESQQAILRLQMEAASQRIQSLRASQEHTAVYRHDMRHHLSLLLGYAKEGDVEKMKAYLVRAQADLRDITPVQFCENQTANLILSSFDARAKKAGVDFTVEAHLPEAVPLPETELCALLSNLLENAITASVACPETSERKVHFHARIRERQLLISTENPYIGTLELENGLPKTTSSPSGHGFGLKSILTVVERHHGLYTLDTDNQTFLLRLVIPLST